MAGVAAIARTQEERTEAAKQRLREAALQLFGSDGYDATTLSAISLKAGFSRTLAQYHYPEKSALALELLEERISRDNHLELLDCPDDATAEEAWGCLVRHLAAVASYYGRLHGSCDLGVAVRGEMALHSAALMGADTSITAKVHALTVDLIARIERLFETCRKGGLIPEASDSHALAILHVHSIWGLAQALFANPKGIRPVTAAFAQIGVLLDALRVPAPSSGSV
jgi:AcrR family transcriptional regulator